MKNSYITIKEIIKLIEEQEPEMLELIKELETFKKKKWIPQAYIPFKYPEKSNSNNTGWKISESVVLEHKTEGTIVLDILENGKIGGIEFVNKIPQ